jgi:hypothetical protein
MVDTDNRHQEEGMLPQAVAMVATLTREDQVDLTPVITNRAPQLVQILSKNICHFIGVVLTGI